MTLNGFIGKGTFVYMDDIVIYVKTLEKYEKSYIHVNADKGRLFNKCN